MAFTMVILVRMPKYCIGLKVDKEKTIKPKAAANEVNREVFPASCNVLHTAIE